MKLNFLIALMAAAMFFACSESENDLPEPSMESVVVETSERNFEVYPIEDLVSISNGFFWVKDQSGMAYGFADGDLICNASIPNDKFQQAELKASAKPGFYKLDDAIIAYNEGIIGIDVVKWKNCVTRTQYVPRDCPPGQLGADKIEITDCYSILTGRLISSDTVSVPGGIPCTPIELPKFEIPMFEDEWGNKYLNPICF
ncbi:MAG: hypothetical protein NXI20_03500 [bacterium]|nr:hypothetical protein [bacterium]